MTHAEAPPADDPLVVDSRRLPRQPGASLRLNMTAIADGALRNDVSAVPAGSAAPVELLLESVLDGILVTGTADVPRRSTCVRCLDDVETVDPVRFQQFFTYPGVPPAEDQDSDVDVTPMTGPWLDLRAAFRDATLLALPLTPTCRSDCPGLCPECGFRLADDPEHRHEHRDPRWSALARWNAAEGPAAPEGE